jgi:hypothetical protein
MSAELPLSTKIQWMTWFATIGVTINASSYGITTPHASSSEKEKGIKSFFAALEGLCKDRTSSTCIFLHAFLAELDSPPPTIPHKIVRISPITFSF